MKQRYGFAAGKAHRLSTQVLGEGCGAGRAPGVRWGDLPVV